MRGGNIVIPSWRRILKPSLLELVFLVWCAYLIVLDPLNVDTYGDRIASNFYNAVFSPFYPVGGSSADGGQAEIVVLVYDDAYLEAASTAWGFSPNEYKPLFTRVAEAGARAVFFDIQFLRGDGSRDTAIASLYKHADALEERHGTKFVFAGVLAEPMPAFDGVAARRYALAEMSTSEEAYALYEGSTVDPYYALPTAAAALYRIWCETRCRGGQFPAELDSELFVEWGFAPDPKMRSYSAADESGALCQEPGSLWRSAQVLFSVVRGRSGSELAPCMYHRNFSVYFINSPRASADFDEILQGKLVLIGASVAAHSDYTQSPVHGTIPGVFKHAMALDNLIERGGDYVRWVDDAASQIFELIVLAMMLAGLLLFRNVAVPDEAENPDADLLRALYGAAAGLFLWLVVLATIAWFRWGPNNWGNYFLMFALVFDVSLPALWRLVRPRFGDRWPARILVGALLFLAVFAALAVVAVILVLAIIGAHTSRLVYALESLVLIAVLVTVAVHMRRRIPRLHESPPLA